MSSPPSKGPNQACTNGRSTGSHHSSTTSARGCRLKLPAELDHEVTRIDFALPGAEQLGEVLSGIIASAKLQAPDDEFREAVLNAALGLTTIEAENAFALSVVESGTLDPSIISREKARALKRNGLVEVIETNPRSMPSADWRI